MGTTQPIKEKENLEKFMTYYRSVHPSKRNYALLVCGIHTALRISDILNLQWKDLYDFRKNQYRTHIFLHEKKTGKQNLIAVNRHITEALDAYKTEYSPAPDDYIFSKTTDHQKPLNRSQAFRIVKKAALETLHETNISCHSLRKTFGYHAWKLGTPPALLMDIYNHSSYQITKKYLGIEQDERDSIFLKMDIFSDE